MQQISPYLPGEMIVARHIIYHTIIHMYAKLSIYYTIYNKQTHDL